MNIAYMLGLIETDGTFAMTLDSNGNPKPEVRISQRTNTNLLSEISCFLLSCGITSTFESFIDDIEKNPTKRAPNLRIQGSLQILKLISLFNKRGVTNLGKPFIGVKERDCLIVDCLLTNKQSLNSAQKIDLKKSLHKETYNEPDRDLGALDKDLQPAVGTRLYWEKKLNLKPGESINAAKPFLDQIDFEFSNYQKSVRESMANGSLMVDDDYIRGLIDGDGSYTSTFQFREPHSKIKTRSFDLSSNCSLHMEKSADIVLDVFVYKFQLSSINKQAKPNSTNPTSYQMYFRKDADVRKILSWATKFPPIGNKRLQQFEVLKEIYRLKDAKLTQHKIEIQKLLPLIYAIPSSGPKRQLSLEQALKKVLDFCKK